MPRQVITSFNSFWDATHSGLFSSLTRQPIFQFLLGCYSKLSPKRFQILKLSIPFGMLRWESHLQLLFHPQTFNSFWDATSKRKPLKNMKITFNSFWDATKENAQKEEKEKGKLSIPFGMLRPCTGGLIPSIFLSIPFGMLRLGRSAQPAPAAALSIPFGMLPGSLQASPSPKTFAFNSFWDATCRFLSFYSAHRWWLSIPFGMLLLSPINPLKLDY